MNTIYLVSTGVANLASVSAAFERLGFSTEVTNDPERIKNVDRVVLPGVGSYRSAVEAFRENELEEALVERIENDRPTLGICLGLQLLGSRSEESPKSRGLSLFYGSVVRMDPGPYPIPQMGWNEVRSGSRFCDGGTAYFANSFAFDQVPDGWTGSFFKYGDRYVASLERGNVLACQFHPELSGSYGESILSQWVTSC